MAALIGYVFRMKLVIIMLLIYLAFFIWGSFNALWIIQDYWRPDFLLYQGAGMLAGAFFRKVREKYRMDGVTKIKETTDKKDKSQ